MFGFSTKHSDNNTCYTDDYPIENGIYCNKCNTTIIKNNDIMSHYALTVANYGNHNNITNNVFRTYYNYQPIITFEITTSNNIFCNDHVIRSIPTLQYLNEQYTCFWGTETKNANTIVSNTGSNTITSLCTQNCDNNWYCDGIFKIFINSNCSITANRTCQYGCESGVYGSYCIGQEYTPIVITTTTTIQSQIDKWKINYTDTVVNQTDLQEAGLNWMTPFFTSFFLIIILELIIASIIAWVSKQAITFPITIFILTMMFGYYGMFSLFTTAIICIITALLTATMFKSMSKG
jgi:hypothetical protein